MSTIATLTSTESGANSLTDINNNFSALNTSKAELASPTFTDSPVLPTGTTGVTQSANNNSTKLATTAYVDTGKDNNNIKLLQALGSVIKAEAVGQTLGLVSGSNALSDGVARFLAVYIPYSMTITGVKWYQRTQGSYTADNNNYVALYSYSGGTLTQVAISADDGNIWKATADTMGSVAFTATYSASPGVYFVGLLYNTSSQITAPALGTCLTSYSGSGISPADFTNSVKMNMSLSSQTSLTTPLTASALSAQSAPLYIALY